MMVVEQTQGYRISFELTKPNHSNLALLVTQIALAVFLSFGILLFYVNGMSTIADAVSGGTSVIIIIAGRLAIAAQNLHLPTTGFENYLALQKLVLSVQIALSATLAAYCCKVIQCCCPTSSMPVITVNRLPDPR
ncbi:hypothetical protein DPX16_17766 [Anabarilius grahami]|uniref:Uncharacterized protein n=1 Tax=Anabarilius grahami TaxID=495550 RepID=A0A3N0YID4_ANAGA|nr:hypothetical protein DPX16_17766 [Anabarilius grahami]